MTTPTEPRTGAETALCWMLRIIGASSLTALVFVAAPERWMDSIHRWLGMGPLPEAPVVGYLARSTSAFYAITGGLMILVSTDLRRYRPVVDYLGAATALFGAALLVIDWQEGLPPFWTLWEGPFVCAFGVAVMVLSRRTAAGR